MNDDELLRIQRVLRRRLFEGEHALRWRPGRELAAQLLLYLDEPATCWTLATAWLRETLDADRADGGFGGFLDADGQGRCYVVAAEARRPTMALPSVKGIRFDAADPGIRAVWHCEHAAWVDEVAQERSFSPAMRASLGALGTAAKLALPLRDEGRAIGLMCADWNREIPHRVGGLCDELAAFARFGLGPMLAASARLGQGTCAPALPSADDAPAPPTARGLPALPAPHDAVDHPLGCLTPAELRVARLVANGLSYKEVARQLDRSLSTVDHQLRHIREKLGVRSTARLVHLLNERRN